MLRTGCWVLTTWTASNLILSIKIVWDTLLGSGHSPALFLILTETEVDALGPDTLATLDSIAVFANGLNIAFCALALCLIWRGLFRRQAWSFGALLVGFLAAWFAGAAADFVVGTVAPWVNVVSFVILATGFVFSAVGLFKRQLRQESL